MMDDLDIHAREAVPLSLRCIAVDDDFRARVDSEVARCEQLFDSTWQSVMLTAPPFAKAQSGRWESKVSAAAALGAATLVSARLTVRRSALFVLHGLDALWRIDFQRRPAVALAGAGLASLLLFALAAKMLSAPWSAGTDRVSGEPSRGSADRELRRASPRAHAHFQVASADGANLGLGGEADFSRISLAAPASTVLVAELPEKSSRPRAAAANGRSVPATRAKDEPAAAGEGSDMVVAGRLFVVAFAADCSDKGSGAGCRFRAISKSSQILTGAATIVQRPAGASPDLVWAANAVACDVSPVGGPSCDRPSEQTEFEMIREASGSLVLARAWNGAATRLSAPKGGESPMNP